MNLQTKIRLSPILSDISSFVQPLSLFYSFLKIFIFIQFLKITFHLQLLQNMGSIPCVGTAHP